MGCFFWRSSGFLGAGRKITAWYDALVLARLNDKHIAISTGPAALTILKHEMGTCVTKLGRFKVLDSVVGPLGVCSDMASHKKLLVVLGTSGIVEVRISEVCHCGARRFVQG